MDKKVIIELFIDEEDQDNALDMISFVSAPAIEKNFMHFKEDKLKFDFKATDEEKRIVTGAAMVPNQEIIRLDAEGNPYFVFFTEETVEKAQEVFAKYGKTKSTNFEHETGLRDVTVVESWIVKDSKNDKSNALGFKDIPEGTWFVSYKVDNQKLWEMVKNGDVQGFSIEGVFGQKVVKMKEASKDYFKAVRSIVSDKALSDVQKFDKVFQMLSK